jgi:sugar phosphate isomerase/epimerase
MYLGVAGMIPGDFSKIDHYLVRKISDMGFTGVGAHLAGDPFTVTDQLIQHTRAVLSEQNVRLVQFWGQSYPSIITTDDSARRQAVRIVQEFVRIGAQMGASLVGVRPTSMHASHPWWPHPDNFLPATEDRLVQSLTEIAEACETHQLPIALECHVTTTLGSPQAVRRIIERTGSPWVKMNMDPINFVKDLPTAYNTTAMINELFDELGPYIASAHVKDVYVEDRHVVHISETIPGQGIFDFDTFFRRFEETLPDGYAFIEHLPESQIAQANTFVRSKLAELNIPIRN